MGTDITTEIGGRGTQVRTYVATGREISLCHLREGQRLRKGFEFGDAVTANFVTIYLVVSDLQISNFADRE